jgi:hypothetical protein
MPECINAVFDGDDMEPFELQSGPVKGPQDSIVFNNQDWGRLCWQHVGRL